MADAMPFIGTVGPHLETLHQQMYINIIGYVLWGMGICTASIVIAAYVNRLILHGLPPAKVATSVWVVLGPIGQGANAIMLLGRHTGVLQCTGYLCRVNGKLSKDDFNPETHVAAWNLLDARRGNRVSVGAAATREPSR